MSLVGWEGKNQEMSGRPRLLLAYADSACAARIVRSFRRLGWEVHMAASAAEASRLLEAHAPHAVVLDVGLADEPGWAFCARIAATHPGQHVVLLAGERPSDTHERLRACGAAALVTRGEPMEGLVRAVYGGMLAKAG